jgi:hypothetical protein
MSGGDVKAPPRRGEEDLEEEKLKRGSNGVDG